MHAAALILTSALAMTPAPQAVVADQIDMFELNHYFNGDGVLVFDQLIFWRWDEGDGAFEVAAWRLVKSPHQLPRRDWRRGGYVVIWRDGKILREVRAPAMVEPWTQHDPEMDDRNRLPKRRRSGLAYEREENAMRR